jgi:hypothetical protein
MFHRNFKGILNLYSFVPNGTIEFFSYRNHILQFRSKQDLRCWELNGTAQSGPTPSCRQALQQQATNTNSSAARTVLRGRLNIGETKSMDKHKNCLDDLAPHSAQRNSAGISRVHKFYRPAYVVSVAIAKQEFTPTVVVPCHNMAKKRALVWLSLTDCLL